MKRRQQAAVIAWLITATYYFYQYVLRSAPAVMMPQLSEAFGLSPRRWPRSSGSSTTDIRRSAWSPAWRWTGWGRDRWCRSARRLVGVGALLFASGNPTLANVGRFLQGAGGVFALVGAVYIATTNFPA